MGRRGFTASFLAQGGNGPSRRQPCGLALASGFDAQNAEAVLGTSPLSHRGGRVIARKKAAHHRAALNSLRTGAALEGSGRRVRANYDPKNRVRTRLPAGGKRIRTPGPIWANGTEITTVRQRCSRIRQWTPIGFEWHEAVGERRC
jgi:hypothetical protein